MRKERDKGKKIEGKEMEKRAKRDQRDLYFHLARREALDILGFAALQERSIGYSGIWETQGAKAG